MHIIFIICAFRVSYLEKEKKFLTVKQLEQLHSNSENDFILIKSNTDNYISNGSGSTTFFSNKNSFKRSLDLHRENSILKQDSLNSLASFRKQFTHRKNRSITSE